MSDADRTRPQAAEADPPSGGAVGRVARGGAVNLVGAASSAVLGFALTTLVARGLDDGVAGVFFTTTSAFIVAVALADLGVSTGLVYFISRARTVGTADQVRGFVQVARGPVLVVAATTGLVALVAAPVLGGVIGPDRPDATAAALRWLAPFLVVAVVENLAVSATRGTGTMRPTAVTTLVLRPVAQLVLVGVAVLAARPDLVVPAWAVGYVVSAVVAVVWSRRLLGFDVLRPGGGPGPRGEFWRFTWPRAVMAAAQVAMQRLDVVLVGALAGAVPAAVYAAATRFVVAGQMGAQAVGLAAQPRFAALFAVGDLASVRALYRVSTAWLVLMTWPLYLVLAVYADVAVRVFGAGYEGGDVVVTVLAAAFMLGALLGMVDVLLVMSGRTTWTLVNTLVGFATLVVLDLLLVPAHGVLGAACGWAGAIVLRNVLAAVQVRVALGVDAVGTPLATAVLLAGGAVGVPLVGARALVDSAPLAALLAGMVALPLYAAGCYVARRQVHLPELAQALRRRDGRAPATG
ncbi:lipopolysaccharide biosynthesis protein [Phycicoccus sp. CSK15P-2]|uniref:lipopolysaccharide biosynthesis protein n=1 Tax=Phycicoccus sp. CSK15P-2 TaxID=2807627 RepID=UPI001951A37B|nr:lipopolysaccharide biosynthesis protein [Phycicoccus sp. CSK15P-2]MBM6402705.1 lipopolysaccharide biosynthesis protein [Phycicoccus sp. CSK15P-2]